MMMSAPAVAGGTTDSPGSAHLGAPVAGRASLWLAGGRLGWAMKWGGGGWRVGDENGGEGG